MEKKRAYFFQTTTINPLIICASSFEKAELIAMQKAIIISYLGWQEIDNIRDEVFA